jgi:hypothetical protein
MVVFRFAGQKVSVGFQSMNEGKIRSVTITPFFFKFSEICFYNIFFVILRKTASVCKVNLYKLKRIKM